MADKQFLDDALQAHNKHREHHQVPPLTLSKELCEYSQKWAEHMAATGKFEHSPCTLKDGTRVGENIAMDSATPPRPFTGQQATDRWYSEVKDHLKFGGANPPAGKVTGHFTQVVWKGSKELGVGRASKGNTTYVVANYRPAGNMMGDHADNVLPPTDGKIVVPMEPKMESDSGMPEGGEKRSIKTRKITETKGGKKVTRIITEETITKANGETIVNTSEEVTEG